MAQPHLRIKPREYQVDALRRVDAAEKRGVRSMLGVAATGLGKTVMFSLLAAERGGRTLILAHRDELVTQAAGKVLEIWPELGASTSVLTALHQAGHPITEHVVPDANGVGIIKADADDINAHVIVASVQTLARPKRLARLLATMDGASSLFDAGNPIELVVIDEAHHATADSYQAIIRQLAAGTVDGPLLLGVTATADRGDGKGLDKVFSEVVFNYDILWGIKQGFLADLTGRQVKVAGLDVKSIKRSKGDFEAGAAGKAMEDAGAPAVIARAIVDHAPGRKCLIFTPTVATAEATAAELGKLGQGARMVSGETDKDERRRMLTEFGRGEFMNLANCAVLTEGYDEPTVNCVVVARPTQSRALYAQMIGRGTRRHPEKDDCLVLDVVGASDMHSLLTIPSLFGLGEKARKSLGEGASLVEAVETHLEEARQVGAITAAEAELFKRVRDRGVAWVPMVSKGAPLKKYCRPMGYTRDGYEVPTVVLAQRSVDPDLWTAGLQWRSGAKRVLIAEVSLGEAQGVAEDVVRKQAGNHKRHLVEADQEWRSKPPTPKTIAAAKRWNIHVTTGMTAGEIRDEIDSRAAKSAARRAASKRKKAASARNR